MLWGLHPLWGPRWGPGPSPQGFRSEPATATQVMESLGSAESDRGGLPGEGVQGPEDFPGSRVCSGAQICRVLGMCAALCRAAALCRCCLLTGSLEMPHRSNYSCASGQYCSTDGSP